MMNLIEKPEHMTSLSGDRLVPKTHDRIVFRGLVDSLEADVIEAQVLAHERGQGSEGGDLCAQLGEVLAYLRDIMSAEVKEMPLAPPFLFGMEDEEIRRASLGPGNGILPPEAMLPSYTQGALAARINTLRTKVRELELFAVKVFGPGAEPDQYPREDIILALNRLSSALWWLFCRQIMGT